ncbi:MAG: hypothetical protein WCX73_05870 [Candidatus Pacearchaeota archaeon]|jgi:hypothetical protein
MDEKLLTKAKINLHEGFIELEGTEEFVQRNINSFKDLTKNIDSIKSTPNKNPIQKEILINQSDKIKKPSLPNKEIKEEPFSIQSESNIPALKEYIKSKAPFSNWEKIVVIGDYIIDSLKKDFFTEGQISYAFKNMGFQRPKAFHQMFLDIKNSKKAWITPGIEKDSWKLTALGEDFVRLELPSKDSNKIISKE